MKFLIVFSASHTDSETIVSYGNVSFVSRFFEATLEPNKCFKRSSRGSLQSNVSSLFLNIFFISSKIFLLRKDKSHNSKFSVCAPKFFHSVHFFPTDLQMHALIDLPQFIKRKMCTSIPFINSLLRKF